MNLNQKMEKIVRLSQTIRAQEPHASTIHEKQAAIAMAEISQCINDLIMEKMPVQVIFLSLFYFWLKLEAPLRNVSEKQADQPIPVNEAMEQIIRVTKTVVDSLPNHNPSPEMKKLGTGINDLKSHLSEKNLNNLPPDELIKISTNVNTRIHTVTSNLLMQEFHPEIIANVLFGYWMRVSTLQAYVSEEYYQKMEFYFSEIIEAARKQVPVIFKQGGRRN